MEIDQIQHSFTSLITKLSYQIHINIHYCTNHKSHEKYKNHNAQRNHNIGYTWFTPVWGYVHQLFIFIIIFCQSPYMHRASKPTLHMTGDLCAPRQILLPRVRSQHKAFLHSLHIIFLQPLALSSTSLNTQYAQSLQLRTKP